MDRNISQSVNCKLCGNAYTLPEVGALGNLPHTLLCGHVFCGVCLEDLEDDNTVVCPDCAMESILPEGGVYGLQEDSRIIGLIYTIRMNKIKRMVLGSPSKRPARRCRKSNRPTQIPPPTDTAESADNTDSTDDGKTRANRTDSPTNQIIQTGTGETTAPPPDATPETCSGQELGKAEADVTQECRPAGQDDRRRDDQDLKEKGNVARPDQCGEPPVDVNRVEKLLDEALAQAAENMAHLEHIHQTLVLGQAAQAHRDEERLRVEMDESVVQATQLLRNRQEALLSELKAMEVHFPGSQAQLWRIQERMDAVEIAMKKARQLQLHPSLELYCNLDEILETLQAPVIRESYDLRCLTMGSGLSCVLQTDRLSDCLNTSLHLKTGSPKPLPEARREAGPLPRRRRSTPPAPEARPRTPPAEKEVQGGATAKNEGPRQPPRERDQGRLPTACGNPRIRPLTPAKPLAPQALVPDVIIEDVIEEEEEEEEGEQCEALPPTGPELAKNKRRAHRRKTRFAIAPLKPPASPSVVPRASLYQWVQVTHVVTPNHFYVRYVAESNEAVMLTKKINALSSRPSSFFTSGDTLETGSQVLVRDKVHGWSRGTVVRLSKAGPADVTSCPAHLLTSARIFLPDYGMTTTVYLDSEPTGDGGVDKLSVIDEHMRTMDEHMMTELSGWTPLAVKCSLKDLVPANLKRGWCKEAQQALLSVVGPAVVEMKVFSREKDFLLVDLRKPPMDSASTCPVSVREYLVFIELARFYSPLTHSHTLQFYPPVHPRIQSEHSAIVTHVNTPQDFYIQLVGNMEVHLLSSKLQTCYGSVSEEGDVGLHLYCPTMMQACVARYRDNLWSRACVTGVLGGRTVVVQYVDTGNEATVSVSDLRKIKDEFFSLPAMAIQCSLADVVPADGVTWSQTCSDRFSSLVLNKPVSVITTGQILPQQLEVRVLCGAVQGPLVDLASLLVSEQRACYRDGFVSTPSNDETPLWDPPIDREESSLEPRPQPPISQDSEPRPQLQLPTVLEKVRVKVTHITSPGSFYIQLVKSDALLERVCQRVQGCAQDSGVQDVVWKENMFCAALVNGVWERAQILADVSSDNIAEVQRCDFGGRVKLHVDSLRPLPPSLEGSLALECRLADIRPAGGPTWTATASDYLSHYLTGALALMTIREPTEERPVPVVLLYPNGDGQEVNLADLLANKGLALRERKPRETSKPRAAEHQRGGDPHSHKATSVVPPSPAPSSSDPTPKPRPRTYQSAEKVKTELYGAPELPGPGHNRMRVSAVGEDGVIYLQTRQAESQLEMLRNRIQTRMKTAPQQKPYTWKSVLGCALMGPDMLWYRAQVLEVLRDLVRVRYVDYGSVENIPVVHVYPTLLCDEVPQLCMPCRLNAVIPVGRAWQKDAVALLRELLLQRSVDVQVLEVPADPRGAPTVEIFLDGLSLSRILCHQQHVYMDQNLLSQQVQTATPLLPSLDYWSISTQGVGIPQGSVLGPFTCPTLPQEDTQFRLEVKHICTPNELFIWPLEGSMVADEDEDGLDQMLARVTAEVDRLPHLSFFPPGGPCLAQYGDGQHYRARLMEFSRLDPIMVMVQHVDFGSYDSLPTSKLRQMPSELLRFPVRAMKVRVAGFQPPKTPPGSSVLPYAPQWSVEALLCMQSSLHGHVTASVLSHEPELTVLLYDESGDPMHLPLLARGLADPDYTTPAPPPLQRDSSSTSSTKTDG